jgi:hypothetical protein
MTNQVPEITRTGGETERYVIGFDFGGYGSKRPETELTVAEE